ncbi:MAG: gephyrin-like molybdotransferase Glp [Chloroflexota bacterium]|nr:gephyrin-like molybdotransferase Glp [Lentimicrobium sp.]
MISFEEGLSIVESVKVNPVKEYVPLLESLGMVLASDIYSDVDMPPFDKAAVDGYACRRIDILAPLSVIEVISAGTNPVKKIGQQQCSKIMTGAIVPNGADCILMVEHTKLNEDGTVSFIKPSTGNNIAYKAEDVKKGQLVLEAGIIIKPQHIAMMAAVGCTSPQVFKKPVIGIITTGDELVEPHLVPSGAQIRNSNAYQLMAQVSDIGMNSKYAGIAADTPEATLQMIEEALKSSDVLLITGGVSMGDYDYVPSVIENAGFKIRFRSLAVQPGKPTLFAERHGKFVFGLPGNPVSSFVQFELLVKPLLYKIMGATYQPRTVKLPMATTYQRKRTDRKSFIPVKYALGKIEPIEYHGSAHIHSFEQAWGIMAINIGEDNVKPGELRDIRQLN